MTRQGRFIVDAALLFEGTHECPECGSDWACDSICAANGHPCPDDDCPLSEVDE